MQHVQIQYGNQMEFNKKMASISLEKEKKSKLDILYKDDTHIKRMGSVNSVDSINSNNDDKLGLGSGLGNGLDSNMVIDNVGLDRILSMSSNIISSDEDANENLSGDEFKLL